MVKSTIKEAIESLQKGGLIIVVDDDNREAEGDLVGVANLVTPESVNFMTKFARGLICAPISENKARQLGLIEMVPDNTDDFGTAFTVSVDYKKTSTGISTSDRALTIQSLSKSDTLASDLHRPGHIFPLIAKKKGVLERRGHTEAAVDLAKLTNQSESAYICEILNDDGSMARRPQLNELAKKWQMPLISVEDLVNYVSNKEPITVELPTSFGQFDLTLFEDEGKEHLLLSKGDITHLKEPVLIRVHSECLTGDVFGSSRCDCGEQLIESMKMIEENGAGAIIYLRQEGRGIGLKNKLKTYQLQEKGMDTFDANVVLGFKPDERNYLKAVEILQFLGIDTIRLITNNPDKIEQLRELGINVMERVAIDIKPVKENKDYLETKKEKFHHLLAN